jgi:DNA-binding transcriptional regulator YiaG
MTPADFTAARKSLGLTQAQLVPLFGRTLRQVKRWESEGPDPMASILMRLYLATDRAAWPVSP